MSRIGSNEKRKAGNEAVLHSPFSLLRSSFLGLAALLLASAAAAQEEPPIRLKRKDKPEEAKPAVKEPAKDKDDKKEPAPDEPALKPGEDPKQVMERIARNMRAAEERLKGQDPGDGTQQVQRDIIKDLDKLIQHSKQQEQNQQQQQGMAGSGGGKSSRNSRQQRASGGQGSRPQGQNQPQNKEGTGESQANSKGQGSANQGGKGSTSPTGPNHIADLHKDIWGHLPEAMRQQMDAYSRETFMLKYQDLLRQYYATLAEKGRKGEESR